MGTGDSASGQLPSKLFHADLTKLRTCNRLTQRSGWHANWLTDLNATVQPWERTLPACPGLRKESVEFSLALRGGNSALEACAPRASYAAGGYLNVQSLARPALRRANARQETQLHLDCRHHAQLRHWREHRHFQRGQCRALAVIALSRL